MLKFLLYKLGHFISVKLSKKNAYRLAIFLADIHCLISKRDRDAITANLKIITPVADRKMIAVYRKNIFRNFAKYMVDFFRFSIIQKADIENDIEFSGLDIVDSALKKSKGVIVLTAHIANWELGGIAMALLGYPIVCVALTHRNKKINDFFIKQRENKGFSVIPLGNAAFRSLQALKKNKVLALAGDRDFTQSGIVIDFFGKPTIIPKGPAAFSLKTGSPLLIGILSRKPNDKFSFVYEGPITIDASGDEEKDIIALSKKFVAVFERYIRKNPDQWLMFRRFWEPVEKDACE